MCHSLRLQAGLKHPKRREGGSGLHLFWNRLITKAADWNYPVTARSTTLEESNFG